MYRRIRCFGNLSEADALKYNHVDELIICAPAIYSKDVLRLSGAQFCVILAAIHYWQRIIHDRSS